MTMLEKVARALVASYIKSSNVYPPAFEQSWEELDDRQKDLAFEQARAAITAMREPTEEMLNAEGVGWAADHCSHIDRDPEHYWMLMVDAALSS